jgi:hypothetical protein
MLMKTTESNRSPNWLFAHDTHSLASPASLQSWTGEGGLRDAQIAGPSQAPPCRRRPLFGRAWREESEHRDKGLSLAWPRKLSRMLMATSGAPRRYESVTSGLAPCPTTWQSVQQHAIGIPLRHTTFDKQIVYRTLLTRSPYRVLLSAACAVPKCAATSRSENQYMQSRIPGAGSSRGSPSLKSKRWLEQ